MIDVETVIRGQLSKLDPLPATLSGDWDNVLARVQWPAQTRRERLRLQPRRLALVFVLAATLFTITSVATPLGATIEHGFEGFSNWISGSPGTPVSPGAQQKFERQNEHTWNGYGFPKGTQLRELLRTEVAGMIFTLRGFRSGDSLCLHLSVRGVAGGEVPTCVPISALRQVKAPAFVISADNGFGAIGEPSRDMRNLASATFGIASDAVKDVIVSTDDGVGHALVGSGAFLYVADHPSLGMRVRSVRAITADGSTVKLPFSVTPFEVNDPLYDTPTGRPVRGPRGIERKVRGGTIGWLERHEKRGMAIPPDSRPERDIRYTFAATVFAREIQPDPASTTRFVLALGKAKGTAPLPPPVSFRARGREIICLGYYVIDAGGFNSCSYASEVFARGPIGGYTTFRDQFSQLYGFVSDDVHELDLYLTNGTIQKLKITNNIYATTLLQTLFPIRIVARDRKGSIIDNRVIQIP
jgi:hypothetical protein